MTKAEKARRRKFRCIHHHTGITHPACYTAGKSMPKERVGFLDIEASSLKSSFGVMLSYAIADTDLKIRKWGVLTPANVRSGDFDRHLVVDCCEALRAFDRIVTWNGERFDVPFIRTRAMFHRVDFPVYREVLHNDALLLARRVMRTLHSKRLAAVAEFLKIPAKQHPLKPEIWLRALSGCKDALAFILTHNREDVVTLARVWQHLAPFTRLPNTTI